MFGGVGMGPQEHAFRSGVDVIVGTPGRLLDHFQAPYAKLTGLKFLVLDEADRMLDMGFLPDIRRVLAASAAAASDAVLQRDDAAGDRGAGARDASQIRRRSTWISVRRRRSASRRRSIRFPQHLKAALLLALLKRGEIQDALVFTRTKHRADRWRDPWRGQAFRPSESTAIDRRRSGRRRWRVQEREVSRSSWRPTSRRAASTSPRSGTSINFDVPAVPDDYIHRVGRTARAEATGTAFSLVSPEEEGDVRAIERAIEKRLPRVTVPDFDYHQAPEPKGQRCTALRRSSFAPPAVRSAPVGAASLRASAGGPRRAHSVRPSASPTISALASYTVAKYASQGGSRSVATSGMGEPMQYGIPPPGYRLPGDTRLGAAHLLVSDSSGRSSITNRSSAFVWSRASERTWRLVRLAVTLRSSISRPGRGRRRRRVAAGSGCITSRCCCPIGRRLAVLPAILANWVRTSHRPIMR